MPKIFPSGINTQHPYFMRFITGGQYLSVTKVSANTPDGLSALTMVTRLRIRSVVGASNYFGGPPDATQTILTLKNSNSVVNNFRILARVGGANFNNDISAFTYKTMKWYSVGLRYTGAAIEGWIDGQKYFTVAASGTIGATTSTFQVNNSNGGVTSNADIAFARMWLSSLSDRDFIAAMQKNYQNNAALNVVFPKPGGKPAEIANAAVITINKIGSNSAPYALPMPRKLLATL